MVRQLNVFVENKPGRLEAITKVFLNKKINVIAFTIQDRGDFGVMKLLVDKPEQARLALADKSYACALKDVLVVSIKDKPGNLNKLTRILLRRNLNVADVHGFVIQPARLGVCCLELEGKDISKLAKLLKKEGFVVLDEAGFYNLFS